MRHARAEIAALRNRVDANEVRIEEVVLMINELREYMGARFSAMEKAIDARFEAGAQDHGETTCRYYSPRSKRESSRRSVLKHGGTPLSP